MNIHKKLEMALLVIDASNGSIRQYSNSDLHNVINHLNANNIEWEFAHRAEDDDDTKSDLQKIIDETKCQVKQLQEIYKEMLELKPFDICDTDYSMDDMFDAVEYLVLLKKTYGETIEMYKNIIEISLCAMYKRKCNTEKMVKRMSYLDESMRDLLSSKKFDIFDESMYLDYCKDFKSLYTYIETLTKTGKILV